ncbi:hypothetical protein L2E82_21029 [Cichorium intybus]|uniref:Uncharacterized protein n=1 Tax=Cichorium intybus TaxID=13427 RepID=A0ACB9DUS2_CICIN|nr:hypothetical protein L2E82_21029 [Cichorium intybus]
MDIGNNDNGGQNHNSPAPATTAIHVGNPSDYSNHENGENRNNPTSGTYGKMDDRVTNETNGAGIAGTELGHCGRNFGPCVNLVPLGCFGPFPSNGGPLSKNDRRSKKRRLERYSPYSSPVNSCEVRTESLDLNDNPKPVTSDAPPDGPTKSVGDCNGAVNQSEEEATAEIGAKLGFLFQNGNVGIEKIVGENGEDKANQ